MTWQRRTSGPGLLLMGGGIESSALAYAGIAQAGLVINYGQTPAEGERRAALAVGGAVGLDVHILTVDAHTIGAGLLATGPAGHREAARAHQQEIDPDPKSPSPEWWPYRNQLLVTIAAAWALERGFAEIMTGSVLGDAQRHVDGSSVFYDALDALLSLQEGHVRVSAPAAHLTSTELLEATGIPMRVLGYTHSCHIANYACGRCPGCYKAEQLLDTSSGT